MPRAPAGWARPGRPRRCSANTSPAQAWSAGRSAAGSPRSRPGRRQREPVSRCSRTRKPGRRGRGRSGRPAAPGTVGSAAGLTAHAGGFRTLCHRRGAGPGSARPHRGAGRSMTAGLPSRSPPAQPAAGRGASSGRATGLGRGRRVGTLDWQSAHRVVSGRRSSSPAAIGWPQRSHSRSVMTPHRPASGRTRPAPRPRARPRPWGGVAS
jgi:hypothetical protein